MECAIVLGKRGFRRVHLVDAAPEIGGVMRWIPRLPGLGEWARFLNWRAVQLEKLRNVEVIVGTELTAKDIREYGAEIVVVATGARWSTDGLNAYTHAPIPGADAALAHILTPEQIMLEGKAVPGKRVVVYDAEGYFTAAGLAEKLAGEGHDVELATCLERIAPVTDETLEGPMLRQHLHEVGVRQRAGFLAAEIGEGFIRGTDEFGEPVEVEADAVVLATQRLSNESLYLELAEDPGALRGEGIDALYRIGDCVAPRIVAEASYDGHRLAREIDSDDPATPLPYTRERIVLESAAIGS
jgi:dimethylamine/trimethylamine dehydrogenase